MSVSGSLGSVKWSSGYIPFPDVAYPQQAVEFAGKNKGFARIDLPLPTTVVCPSCEHQNIVEPGHVYFVPYGYDLWWDKGNVRRMFSACVANVQTPFTICQNPDGCREHLLLVQVDNLLIGYPRSETSWHDPFENMLRTRLQEEYGEDPRNWSKDVLRALNPNNCR